MVEMLDRRPYSASCKLIANIEPGQTVAGFMEDMVMSETMAVFWIMILFIARFAIPLLFILGSGHLFNTWLARQNQAAK